VVVEIKKEGYLKSSLSIMFCGVLLGRYSLGEVFGAVKLLEGFVSLCGQWLGIKF
jgi:hypothetical protein